MLCISVNGWLSRFTKAVIVNSKAGLVFHLKQGFTAEKLTFIPNSVGKTFDADHIRQKIRKRFKFTETDRVALRRLDPMKAHDAVMAAAANVQKYPSSLLARTQTLKTPENITCLGVWKICQNSITPPICSSISRNSGASSIGRLWLVIFECWQTTSVTAHSLWVILATSGSLRLNLSLGR